VLHEAGQRLAHTLMLLLLRRTFVQSQQAGEVPDVAARCRQRKQVATEKPVDLGVGLIFTTTASAGSGISGVR
jgi:hypothetical protein